MMNASLTTLWLHVALSAAPPPDAGSPAPTSALEATLRTEAGAARPCYEAALKAQPGLEGTLVVQLVLDATGAVKSATVAEDRLGSTEVAACVLGRLSAARFPGAGATTVRCPLAFSSRVRAVAVLPFENQTGDPALDWMRNGLPEGLMTKLGQMKTLVLVDRIRLGEVLREQALAQSGGVDDASAARVGLLAGAQYLVVGAVQKAGTELKLVSRVVHAERAVVFGAAEARGPATDLFNLQDRLAQQLAAAMNVELDDDARAALALRVANSTAELAVLARGAEASSRNDNAAAAAAYRELLLLNPAIPEAHLGLAWSLVTGRKNDDVWGEVRLHMEKALQLRPGWYEAESGMGFLLWKEGRADESLAAQQRALRLKPGYAAGYYGVGLALLAKGAVDDAVVMLRRAVELDPACGEFKAQLALTLATHQGPSAESRALAQDALLHRDVNAWHHVALAHTLLWNGDAPACLKAMEVMRTAYPKPGRVQPYAAVVEAACHAKAGHKEPARAYVKSLPREQAQALASGELGPAVPPQARAEMAVCLEALRPFLGKGRR